MSETPKCPTCKRAQDVDLTWYCSNCGSRIDADPVQAVLEAAVKLYNKQTIDYDLTPELKDLNAAVLAYKEMEKKK